MVQSKNSVSQYGSTNTRVGVKVETRVVFYACLNKPKYNNVIILYAYGCNSCMLGIMQYSRIYACSVLREKLYFNIIIIIFPGEKINGQRFTERP